VLVVQWLAALLNVNLTSYAAPKLTFFALSVDFFRLILICKPLVEGVDGADGVDGRFRLDAGEGVVGAFGVEGVVGVFEGEGVARVFRGGGLPLTVRDGLCGGSKVCIGTTVIGAEIGTIGIMKFSLFIMSSSVSENSLHK
jgi:hypothetical protein